MLTLPAWAIGVLVTLVIAVLTFAWRLAVKAGSASAPGEIDWGPGSGLWELGSNGGGERPVSTIYRAGVEEAVWDATAWAAFYAKLRGIA